MIHQTSYDTYNKLMNHLFDVATEYYAMSLQADSAGLKGFEAMLRNESHERWHLGDCIAEYLIMNDKKPILTSHEQPRQDYANPMDMLASARAIETATLEAIIAGAEIAVENDPSELKKMGWLKKKCLYEHNEINEIAKKMAIPGANLAAIDAHLKEKYDHDGMNPCGRYKR